MNLLSTFIANVLMQEHHKPRYGQWALTLFAVLTFGGGYIFACLGLYHYLLPQWGRAISLFVIGGVCLGASLILFLFKHSEKQPSSPWEASISDLEKKIGETFKQISNTTEVLKIIRPYVSLKSLGALVIISAALAAYLSHSKKE